MAGPWIEVNARERRLLGMAAFGAAVFAILAAPLGLELVVHSARAENEDLRTALADVQRSRGAVREHQAKKDAITQRYARKPPSLAGFLEQTARQEKLEVTESTPMPDVPHGKKYMEHGTDIHLKKTGMLPVVHFLEAVEKSGFPLAITRLNVRKRTGENDSFDIQVGVSSYEKSEAPASTAPPTGSTKP